MMVKEQIKPRTIVRNPQILLGEPTVEGTRIAVRHIVLYRIGYGSVEGVQQALPSLSIADIEAALQFYREHRDEINIYIDENNEDEDIPYDELRRL